MSQKGFVNIIVIIGIVIIASAASYFINKQTFSPATTPLLIPSSTPTTTQPTTDTRQKPSASNTAEYPYILKPLPHAQLSSLRSEFAISNKNVCAQIDEYGLVNRKNKFGKDGCNDETVKIEIIDETSIIELVKNWLVKNSKFTGVTKKSDAVFKNVVKIYGCIKCDALNSDRKIIGLQIYFREQTYNGLPIEGDFNPLSVFANEKGVSSVDGHFFPNITVPTEPKISENSAKNNLIGKIFTYNDMAGDLRSYRVGGKKLTVIAKVVFVKKSSQGLEFRLAWKIIVGQGLPWTVYVDAITGEELKVVQMFQT